MKLQKLNKIYAISLEGISGNRPSALRGRSARKTGGVLAWLN